MNENFPEVMRLGALHKSNNNLTDAILSFEKAIKLGPSSEHALLMYFICAVDLEYEFDLNAACQKIDKLNFYFSKYLWVYYQIKKGNFDSDVKKKYLECLGGFNTGSEQDWYFFKLFEKIIISPNPVQTDLKMDIIPRSIFMYFDKNPPIDVVNNFEFIKGMKDFEVKMFNRDETLSFLQDYYGHESVQIFSSLTHPSAQSDYFRWHIIHAFGGYYIDADDTPFVDKFRNVVFSQNCEVLLYRSSHNLSPLQCGFFGACAKTKTVERAINLINFNCLKHPTLSMWLKTGPGVITRAMIYEYLLNYGAKRTALPVVGTKIQLNEFMGNFVPSYRQDERDWRVFESNNQNN